MKCETLNLIIHAIMKLMHQKFDILLVGLSRSSTEDFAKIALPDITQRTRKTAEKSLLLGMFSL